MAGRRGNISASGPNGAAAFWLASGGVIQTMMESVGLPGTFLILAYFFIDRYASIEQKRAMIDMYVLWRSSHDIVPFVIYSLVVLLLMLAQRHYYMKKIKVCQAEVDRIGKEKSILQEQLSPPPIHHSGGKSGS